MGQRGLELREALAGHELIGVDSSIWLYHLEANDKYLPLTNQILEGIEAGERTGAISVVTVMEVTVRPYAFAEPNIAHEYEAFLSQFPNLTTLEVTRSIARRAAQLRGSYRMKTPDALLFATALDAGASAWVTNDRDFNRLDSLLKIIVLEDFLDATV